MLDLFLLRKHFIEEVIHVCFRSDNDSNAMVIELVNHLHKARQFVLLRHIELRNISNNHRVERGRNRFIVIRPAILFLTRIIHFHFLADLLVIHTTNAVLRCGKMNRPRWRQRQIERLRSRRTQLREHSVYFSNKHSSQTKHGVRRRTVWREDDIVHRMREDPAGCLFRYEDESSGTQRMMYLSAHLVWVLNNGGTLVVDELERSIHPMLVDYLIGVVQDPEANPRGAQLIFTTHDTGIVGRNGLGRDQIWIASRNPSVGVTVIYPFTNFEDDSDFETLYMDSRIGGVPNIREGL